MADRRLKEALKPLIAKIERMQQGGDDVLKVNKNGQNLNIPFTNKSLDSDTNTLE